MTSFFKDVKIMLENHWRILEALWILQIIRMDTDECFCFTFFIFANAYTLFIHLSKSLNITKKHF